MKRRLQHTPKIMVSVLLVLVMIFSCFSYAEAKTKIKSKSVTLNASKATLFVGNIITLSATMKPANSTDTLRWYSSDETVATVNKYGVVTGLSEGEAIITVKTSSKKTAVCEITVEKALSAAEIQQMIANNTMSKEDVLQLILQQGSATQTDAGPVTLMKSQNLPMLISDPSKTGIIGSITSMTVTKRPMTSSYLVNNEYHFLPYRYEVIMTSTVNIITDAQKSTHYIELNLGAPNVTAKIDQSRELLSSVYTGNTFTEIVVFYSAYNIDEFFVESAKWVSK